MADTSVTPENLLRPEAQARRARPVLREARFGDCDQIIELQRRNGLPVMPRETWTSLWTGNPVYRRLERSWPIGWVLETGARGAVGFIASVPVAYRFRGREIVAAVTGSWVTDAGYRAYSMAVLSAVMNRGGAELYLTNTATAITDATLRLLGWSRVPAGDWDTCYLWITGSYGLSRSFFANRKIPLPGVPAIPAALALWLRSRWAARRSPVPARAGTIDRAAAFDARFDAFWEELQYRDPGVLLGLRSREALAWHFAGALAQGRLRILTRSRGSRMTAYAIFDQHDSLGLKRFRLVDFQALEDGAAALASFLAGILEEMRGNGAHVLESAGYPLRHLGEPGRVAPYRRTLDAWKFYFRAATPELREALSVPAAWAPSYYDGNASL